VLFIGGGGFSGPKQFLEYYPDVTVDVVEIDPVVVDTAWEYFGMPDDPRLRVYVGDGRAFLGRLGTYDLIVLDAYSKTYVPFHLMTREFFEALAEHLNPEGVVVSNLVSSLLGDTSNLLMAEVKTVGEVFPQVYLFPTKDDLLAMAMDAPVRGETLAAYCGNLFDRDIDTKDSPLLTDDYAPTETLLNPVTNSPYKGG